MKTFRAGKDISIDVLFQQGMDTVVPDVGSVKYSVYDNSGVALVSDVAVSTDLDTTSVAIPILAANNGIGTDDFQYRTIVVDYKLNGGTREQSDQYRLVKFIQLPVNNDDVRSLIGFSVKELPDPDIDLITAYFEVADDIGADVLTASLSAKNATTRAAQRMIICQALIDLLPGFQFRVMSLQKSNTSQVERIAKLDFDALTEWLYSLYITSGNVITTPSTVDVNAGVIMAIARPSTDPITAAAPSST